MTYPKSFMIIISLMALLHILIFAKVEMKQTKVMTAPKPKIIPLNLSNVKIEIQQKEVKKPKKIIKKKKVIKKPIKKIKKIKPKPKKKIIKKIEKKKVIKKLIEKKIVKKVKPATIKKTPIVKKKPEFTVDELKAIEDKYLFYVKQTIEDNKIYPYRAKRLNQIGTVTVYFTIYKDGRIKNVKIEQKSKYKNLDKSAIKIFTKIVKFQPIPTKLKKQMINISIPIEYKIIR